MWRRSLLVVLTVLVAASPARAAGPELKTDDEKTLYALGLALARNLGPFNLTEKELDLVKSGLSDGVLNHKPQVDIETFGPKIQALAQARASASAAGEKKASEAFLAKAAAEKGATKTPSGLIFSEIKAGTGDTPKPTDKVSVNYKGTRIDGSVFDSSEQHGQAATFKVDGVIPCWTEGLQKMKVGGKAKLICPSNIAYGDGGKLPTIKPGATLVFEVELLEIVK